MELFGFGQRVDVKHEMYSTGIVIFFNSKGKERFIIKLQREDFGKFWEAKDFVTDIMKEFGRDSNFWAILGEKLNDQFGLINSDNGKKETKQIKKPIKETVKDIIPQIEMTASYAQINFKGNIVEVVFTNETESNTVTFKHRKSWSNRKYLDTAIVKSGIKPSWDFHYGWDMAAV